LVNIIRRRRCSGRVDKHTFLSNRKKEACLKSTLAFIGIRWAHCPRRLQRLRIFLRAVIIAVRRCCGTRASVRACVRRLPIPSSISLHTWQPGGGRPMRRRFDFRSRLVE
jgi:hypothetical protein